MFMSSLLNVWKFFGKLRKKHPRVQKQTFRQVSKIFKNFRKSLEVFGKNRRMSQSAQNDLSCIFEFFFFEIFGNYGKSSEIFGNYRKVLKTIFRQFLLIFENLKRKSSEMFGNARKTSRVYETFKNIPISYTCGLKIGFKNFDL